MRFVRLVETSETVAATSRRLGKIDAIARFLAALSAEEIPVGVAYLSGDLPQGRIGVGHATVAGLSAAPAAEPTLGVMDVDGALSALAGRSGPGSQAERATMLADLLARCTATEQRFLGRLLLGDLRQGALEGVMIEALAKATGIAPSEVRRAAMLAGDLARVAVAARTGGADAVAAIRLTVLRPLQPMLARSAGDPVDAITRLGTAALEYKVDGARIQVHRSAGEVRVFTRKLNDVTANVPDIVAEALAFECDSVVLDGEAVVLRDDGRPLPFQVTMARFGRSVDVGAASVAHRLTPLFFDILHLDGTDLLDEPGAERWDRLAAVVPEHRRVRRTVTDRPEDAAAFLQGALGAGHEGIMAKALDAPYEAGHRGAAWLKVKPVHTLDLVVLAVEWGSGRRRGLLSNIHLGARDPDAGGFVMLGKTFKGMTDEMLAWQTERFLSLETHREGRVVHLRPEQVVEIAIDGIQASTRYPGGLALRFARVKGYRSDKPADEADTIDTVRRIAGT